MSDYQRHCLIINTPVRSYLKNSWFILVTHASMARILNLQGVLQQLMGSQQLIHIHQLTLHLSLRVKALNGLILLSVP